MPYATNPDDGVRIYYEVEGDGPPIILYPGAGGTLHFMREFGYVTALRNNYTTISLDPRGSGLSDKPYSVDDYSPQLLVADVTAILDAFDVDSSHFFGWSRGAWVGYAMGKYAEHRLISLILGCMHPFARQAELTNAEEQIALVEFLEATYGPMPPATRNDFLTNDIDAFNAAAMAASDVSEIAESLDQLTVPCFIYCGCDDDLHDGTQRAAATIPTATFLSLYGLDHVTIGP